MAEITEAAYPDHGRDTLTNFFGARGVSTDHFDPTQHAALVSEALKNPAQRDAEINTTIMDEQHELVSAGREIGHQLAAFSQPMAVAQAAAFLDGKIEADLKEADSTAEAVVERLRQRITNLDTTGPETIFRQLREDEATVQEGQRRQAGQQELTRLKIVLLGISESHFQDGGITRRLEVIDHIRYEWALKEPQWYTRRAAQVLEAANLQDESTRLLLVDILNHGNFGLHSTYIKQATTAESVDQLSPLQRIARRVMEAEELDLKIKAAQEAERAQAEYEKKLEQAWVNKIDNAVTDGEDMFKEHLKGGSGYAVRFRGFGQGSALLVELSRQHYNLWTQITRNNQERGVTGYLNVLDTLLHQPGMLDQAVARLTAKGVYSDLAGKLRREYETEDRLDHNWKHTSENNCKLKLLAILWVA